MSRPLNLVAVTVLALGAGACDRLHRLGTANVPKPDGSVTGSAGTSGGGSKSDGGSTTDVGQTGLAGTGGPAPIAGIGGAGTGGGGGGGGAGGDGATGGTPDASGDAVPAASLCQPACAAPATCIDGLCRDGVSRWVTAGGDLHHTGFAADETGHPPLTRAWHLQFSIINWPQLGPAISDGYAVYAAGTAPDHQTPLITAVRASDGSTIWSNDLDKQQSCLGHLSLDADHVYVTTCGFDAYLHAALFRSSGKMHWASPTLRIGGGDWPSIAVGSTVFAPTYGGGIVAMRAGNGEPLFGLGAAGTGQISSSNFSALSLGDRLYTYVSGRLAAWHPDTGDPGFVINVDPPGDSRGPAQAPVSDGKKIYITGSSALRAFRPGQPTPVWAVTGDYANMVAVANGVVFALSGGQLRANDAETGKVLWTFAGDSKLTYPPVVAGRWVYVSSEEHAYAVDTSTQESVWDRAPGGWLSIGAGHLYVSQTDGDLVAYALTGGNAPVGPAAPEGGAPDGGAPDGGAPVACVPACTGAGESCVGGVCRDGVSRWSTVGGDMHHTGWNPYERGGAPLGVAWTVDTGFGQLWPAVSDGATVVVTRQEGNAGAPQIFAVDAANGKVLWSTDYAMPGSTDRVGAGQATMDAGRVYFAHDGELEAALPATGKTVWHQPIGPRPWAPVPVGPRLYLDAAGGLAGISAADGSSQVTFDPTVPAAYGPPLPLGSSICRFTPSFLSIFPLAGGDAERIIRLDEGPTSSASQDQTLVSDGARIFVTGMEPPALYAYEPRSSTPVWKITGEYKGTAAVADGVVLAIVNRQLRAHDARDGRVLWTFPGDSQLVYTPIVAGHVAYVASYQHVYAFDMRTQSRLWQEESSGWLSVAGAQLLVARSDGTLTAYTLPRGP